MSEAAPAEGARGFWLRHRGVILAAAVFLAALTYFAWNASGISPELAESQDIEIAHDYLNTFRIPVDQSPIYYMVLAAWMKVGGTSVAYLRIPSLIAGAVAVLFIYLLMSAEVGTIGGLLAALFLATNSGLVFYSRSTRCYAMMVFFAAICMWYLRRYVNGGRRWRDFFGCLAFAVAGVYTHLFFLLFAGSMGLLLVIDLARHRPSWRMLAALAAPSLVAAVAMVRQGLRTLTVTHYTEGRHSIYQGLEHHPIKFFAGICHGFFRSGLTFHNQKILSDPDVYVMAVFAALVLAGMIALRWRGVIAGLVIFVPTLVASYHLSADSAVWSRYVLYMVAPIAAFTAAGFARLRRAWLWAPLAFAVAVQGVSSVNTRYAVPTDWPEAVARIHQLKKPGDVVAVFPHFWRYTFQSYYGDDDFTPFYHPAELERVIARGQRVIVVVGPGRCPNHVLGFLRANAAAKKEFETKVRDKIIVYTVSPEAMHAEALPPAAEPSLLLTGVVSPGDYPWKTDPVQDNPFARLTRLFSSADLVVAPYAPYAPPHSVLSSPRLFDLAGALAKAGVKAAAMLPPLSETSDPTSMLQQAGLQPIAQQQSWQKAAPVIFTIRQQKIGILHVGQRVFTDRPNFRERGDAVVADWAEAVRRAKKAVGPTGRLVIFMPEMPGYDRLFNKEDELIARQAIDLGADAVVGVGGWNAQEVEVYKRGVIAFSLGTLLRPPSQSAVARNSTGLAMRLRFPPERPVAFELVPLTFDDDYHAAQTAPEDLDGLLRPADRDPRAEHLYDHLIDARATFMPKGGTAQALNKWDGDEHSFSADWPKYQAAKHGRMGDWSRSLRGANERQEGFYGAGNFVAMSGALSTGRFRRALSLRAPAGGKVSVTFPPLLLGDELHIYYGVDDNAVADQHLCNPAESLVVSIDGGDVSRQRVEFAVGWKLVKIDTRDFTGRAAKITLTVAAAAVMTFPVALDAIVIRTPEQARDLARGPYQFAEHLREARVALVDSTGAATACLGPDETFRLLRGGKKKVEENGPYAEGVLYQRWVCGDLPWNAVGLTRQKSGGELRPAIWLHPLAKHKRVLTYGPLPLRAQIRGYLGLTDTAAHAKQTPVTFAVLVGGRELYRDSLAGQTGWRPFDITLPAAWRGQSREIAFVSETADDSWRHLCFNAEMQ